MNTKSKKNFFFWNQASKVLPLELHSYTKFQPNQTSQSVLKFFCKILPE